MKETEYKGKKAYLLENSNIRVLAVPELGGKIISACLKNPDFELLYQNDRAAVVGQGFAEGEACGCDDAFPNIDAETVMVGGRSVLYPDHGEIWSSPMTVENAGALSGAMQENGIADEQKESGAAGELEESGAADGQKEAGATGAQEEIVLSCTGRVLPYHYVKKINLLGDGFQVHYKISNTGMESFPCLWVLHDLVRYEEDMELIYPKATETFLNVFENRELGPVGTYYPYDSREKSRWNKAAWGCGMRKYYVAHPVKEGRCGYRYPSQKVCCTMEYDPEKLPYLGVWITEGGFRGDYNLAMEPATGYYDSIGTAQKNGSCPVLGAGEKLEFSIRFRLQRYV